MEEYSGYKAIKVGGKFIYWTGEIVNILEVFVSVNGTACVGLEFEDGGKTYVGVEKNLFFKNFEEWEKWAKGCFEKALEEADLEISKAIEDRQELIDEWDKKRNKIFEKCKNGGLVNEA